MQTLVAKDHTGLLLVIATLDDGWDHEQKQQVTSLDDFRRPHEIEGHGDLFSRLEQTFRNRTIPEKGDTFVKIRKVLSATSTFSF